ncbi:MAG: Ig-like domain-containing protein [Eubacterium sp.]|uniref:Ig-like domain-containing protein n=1 Tax=Eubacterium sp. TaxID=142586 RepID=UPI00300F3FE5
MKRKSTFKSLLALALAVVLVFSTNITPASAAKKKAKATNAVKSVKVVSPAGTKKIATVARGKSIKLTVTVKAKKKAFKKVTYKSSNAKVATVSKKGIVKGKKVGTTTIKVVSVKNKKKTASIKVKVVKNAVKKVTLNKKNLDLAVGASEKLSAKVNAPKKSYKAVKWTSSNEKVVKVSNKGVVSAVGEGTAKVTVTALDGSKKKATCTVAVWNGIKDVQLNNPRNNYYVDSYKVVLDTPIALTKDNFVVKSKVRAEGTYNRELEVEKVFTNDNLNYTIFTKKSVEMGEFVQVSVPSLKGKNAVELQALADGYEYRQLVSGVVGDEINTGVGFKNLVGYETVSVASGNLPAGLAIEKYTNNIKGKVAAVAENQVVNFTGTDELGRTASSKVNFLIGDKNKVVAENKTIGDQANALIYPHEYIGSYINVEGGNELYRATLLDTYNDLFYLDSESTDENGNKYTTTSSRVYVNGRAGKVEAGTYTLRVQFTDIENPTLTAIGTLTVVVTPAVSVTTVLYNYDSSTDELMFYNHDLNETFSAVSADETTDYEKKILTSKVCLPAGNYSVYIESYGEQITLTKYVNLGADTVLSYTAPTRATITGTLKDRSGAVLNKRAYVSIYKADKTDETLATDYVYSYDDGKYEFKCVPNGTYVIKAFDYESDKELATSGTITVTGTNVVVDFPNLPIDNDQNID